MLIKAARKVRSGSKLVAAALPGRRWMRVPLFLHIRALMGVVARQPGGLTGHFRDTLRHRTRCAQPHVHVA